ncbi:MAG: ATP-binding protein [Caulobacter sp.]|nr:ATP-binding protein [Caulobacter sp.]
MTDVIPDARLAQTAIGAEYAAVAAARAKGMITRLGLAAFLACCAWILAPSIWPVLWFAFVISGQGLDWLAFAPLRQERSTPPSSAVRVACFASTIVNTTLYSSLSAYNWFEGGSAGQLMAIVQVAGALVHVSLQMNGHRGLLLAAAVPHAAYLLGLPISALLGLGGEPDLAMSMAIIASLLYLAHLVVAIKQTSAITRALSAARVMADVERDRAEAASASKSDFLATVSHEIRTPMNAVIAAGHLLRRTDLSAEQAAHVDMLLSGSDVLIGVINDVLDISKIEAGKLVIEDAEVSLREKLATLGRLWDSRATDKGVDLRLDIAADVPAVVRGDPLRLQQILFNLISNAVKFTDSGEIVVRVRVEEADRLIIEVADTGCGMSPEALERVFASFEQAHAYTTRSKGGTGLGLTISRRLAEMMGGSLTATSTADEGSIFRLDMPLVEPVAKPMATVKPLSSVNLEETQLSILMADDHEANRRIVSLFLQPTGWRLTMAEDGEEAIALAATEVFDVILMDMQMPRVDGLQATRAIRTGGGVNAATPVVALTANAMDHHRSAWAEVGAEGFISKPIDPRELVSTLATVALRGAIEAERAAS